MKAKLHTAGVSDLDALKQYDRHISDNALSNAVEQNRCFIITVNDQPVGSMRYSLFWDIIPFLNLIYLDDFARRRGIGRQAMEQWEQHMKEAGYGVVMLSTQSDEDSQHFYRALGYRESGCLILDVPGYEQPMEIIFVKDLSSQS